MRAETTRPRRIRPIVTRVLLALFVAFAIAGASMIRPDIPLDELMPRYGTPPSQFVDVDGVRAHYRDEGKAGPDAVPRPPLLLLHGTSSSLHTWDGWVRELGPTRRIVRVDLPGFGLTGPAADGDYRAERLARFVVAFLDRLGLAQVDIAGNSLGGRVALLVALEHPSRVRRLVLLDAAGLSGVARPPIVQLARTPVLRQGLLHMTPRFLVRSNVREVYGEPQRVTGEVVDRYVAMARRAGNREAFLARVNGPADPPLDDRMASLRLPVLVQWGERDRWIPLAHAHRFQRAIAGAELRTYPDLGHVPMEEAPAPTARDAAAFLDR